MKRHAALQHFSREHHAALKLARLARFAADSGHAQAIAEAAVTIIEAFTTELEAHFQAEETELLPAMAAAGAGDLVERTLAEHHALRAQHRRLGEADADILGHFASLLYDHVRFEERELFEAAQALLHPDG